LGSAVTDDGTHPFEQLWLSYGRRLLSAFFYCRDQVANALMKYGKKAEEMTVPVVIQQH
jgi:hypothetical protein